MINRSLHIGFFLFINILFARTTAHTTLLAPGTHTRQPIILWDIHDVLLKRSSTISALWNYPYLWKTITNSSFSLMKDLILLMAQYSLNWASSEHFIKLAQTHHNPDLEKLILHIVNAQEPMPGMIEILAELHRAGYQQHIASNIGKSSFLALTDPTQHPELTPLFSYIDLTKSQIISLEQGESAKKPEPKFFKDYLQKNSIDLAKNPVIFIDNDSENVRVARSLGFDTILFTTPTHLRAELNKRGLIPLEITSPSLLMTSSAHARYHTGCIPMQAE